MLQRTNHFSLCLLQCILGLILLFILSCGSRQSEQHSGFGSIVVQILWPQNAPRLNSPSIHRAVPAGVATMRMIVAGPGMNNMQADFAASLGQGAISGVPAGGSRTLTVHAIDSGGTVIYHGASNTFSVTDGQTTMVQPVTMIPGSTAVPAVPTNVTASAGNAQNTINWTAVTGATSYNIYWSTTTGVSKANGTKIAGATSPYAHSGRTNGTAYYYVVTAENAGGESPESAQVSATPQATVSGVPTGVAAAAGNAQNAISWNAVTGATSYNIYWSTTTGVSKTNGIKITGATSPFTHSGLTSGMTYYYVVTAVSTGGESPESAQVSATPLAPLPNAPASVFATAGNAENTINWFAVTDAISYNIYWSTTSGVTKSNGTMIAGAASPYIHDGLMNGTNYYYVVTAVNAGGESVESSQVSGAPATPWTFLNLPDTGQTLCFDAAGTTIACPLPGAVMAQNGSYIKRPMSFTDNGDGTIKDNVTGLVWQKQDTGTTMTWSDAITSCSSNTLGLPGTGWRLPTRRELMSIVDYGKVSPAMNTGYFPGVLPGYYWSSNTYAGNTGTAWLVEFYTGAVGYYGKTNVIYVRCVR